MFAIKTEEKMNTAKYAETLSNLTNTSDGINVVKILLNYVAKTSSAQSELRELDEEIFKNKSLMKNCLNKVIDSMIEVTVETEKSYSTGELAKYFGVSITAINKWVAEGRFIGVKRSYKNKQLKISENTLWKSRQGELITVKEVVEMYEEDTSMSREEEIKYIKESIKFFEDKYGGIFEETLKFKEDKSSREESDASEWGYEIRKLNK